MADFDPDQYLASTGTATAPEAPPVSTEGFNPDAFLKDTDTSSFNPNAYLGEHATPADRLQALAPLVSGRDAKPEDERAYMDAYKQYHAENSRLHAIGEAVSYPVRHPLDAASTVGSGIWNAIKGVNNYLLKSGGQDKTFTDIGQDYAAKAKGAVSGVGQMAAGLANLGAWGLEQGVNAAADLKSDPKAADKEREIAAKSALQRLKDSKAAEALLGPAPDDPHAADYRAGQIVGNVAAGSMLPVPGVSVAKGGDFVESLTNKLLGTTGKILTSPVVDKASTMAAEVGAVGTAVAHGPAAIIPAALSFVKSGNGSSWLAKGSSLKSGLFKGLNGIFDTVASTKLGQSAIDETVSAAPRLLDQAQQAKLQANVILDGAKQAVADADAAGLPTGKLAKEVKAAQRAKDIADVQSNVLAKGTDIAIMLQRRGASGIPSKLADAVSAAIHGSALGSAVTAANSQPGDPEQAKGAANGAFYGSLLSLLGAAGGASQKAGAKPLPGSPAPAAPVPPTVTTSSPVVPPQPVPASVLKTVQRLPTGTPSGLRQAADALATNHFPVGEVTAKVPTAAEGMAKAHADLREAATHAATHTIDVGGVPHDTQTLADSLKNVTKPFIEKVRLDNPHETFKYRTEDATGSADHSVMLSDQELDQHVANLKPLKSSAFTHGSYDPERNSWSAVFQQPGKQGVIHYAGTEMLPEEWASWMEAKDHGGSIGKYFNKEIRGKKPVIRVHENLLPKTLTVPADGSVPK